MSEIPTTMRHVVVREPGGPEVLELREVPVPEPRAGEVLVRVAYAGVNRPDVMQRAGKYPPPPDASPILGLEISGHVVRLGEGVTSLAEGDLVCALAPGGGYAEYCLVPAAHALPVPDGLSPKEGASLPENMFTVWHNVFERGRLAAGESLLVHGGSSGIGATAIQLAKAMGATVFTTVRNAEKAAFCKDLGADHVVQYTTEDFEAVVASATGRRGVDVVLDMVGGPYVEKNLRALATDGRLVFIAFLKGSRVEVDFRSVMMKRLEVTGSTMRGTSAVRKAAIAAVLRERVWPLFARGALKPVVSRTFPIAAAAEAHSLMETSEHLGKIVLEVAPS